MQIDTLAQGEKYEQEKQQHIQRNAPSGQFDRLASSRISYNKSSTHADPPGLAAQLVSPELPEEYRPRPWTPPGLHSPSHKPLTNGTFHGNGVLTPQSNNTNHVVKTDYVVQPVPGCLPIDHIEENPADRHLLSPAEEKLCSVLRIWPKPYIKIKQHLLNEATKAGGSLKKKQVREMWG